MPMGIEVRDENGVVVFSTATRLYRMLTLAMVDTGGSITVPTGQGDLQAYVQQRTTTGVEPTVTVSGGTVTWSYPAGTRRPVDITVGVY